MEVVVVLVSGVVVFGGLAVALLLSLAFCGLIQKNEMDQSIEDDE